MSRTGRRPGPLAEILRALAGVLSVDALLDRHPAWSREDVRRALLAGAESLSDGTEPVTETPPTPTEFPESVILYADGASRGNPGPAGAGVVLCDESGRPVAEFFEYLGKTTNNVAEYRALLLGLRKAHERGVRRVLFHCDSELLARQLQGRYKVKSPNLKGLYEEARRWIGRLASFRVEHVYRDRNADADALANRAIDEAERSG